MRIEEVDVRGFGRLRETVIPLGSRVNVIVGENESGKSTLNRIIRAALYGIDAGGQGRPVEKSDWSRWAPWSAPSYGFAVTVRLDDGRRLRIAARLDNREQRIQVFEIGGGDITDSMRSGRAVAPGAHLLGVDEAVFAATAWLGEDGLRLGAPETASQRARSLQEAVERLADTGRGTTTAQAIGRLNEALDRIGSERRSQSPLGVATMRQRQLEAEIADARRRAETYSGEQARLRTLEAAVDEARTAQLEAERAWIVGRLASLGTQRLELQRAAAEAAELKAVIAATEASASFRLEDEGTVNTLAGELRQARATAIEAAARYESGEPALQRIRRRRAEIEAGVEALGEIPEIDPAIVNERAALGAELDSADADLRDLAARDDTGDRIEALRREIAGTGLGGVKPSSIEVMSPLIEAALGGESQSIWTRLAGILAVIAAAGAVGAGALHRPIVGVAVAAAGAIAAVVLAVVGRARGNSAPRARRQLARLWPELDLDPAALALAAERLPRLSALHAELLRQEVRATAQHEEGIRLAERRRGIEERVAGFGARFGVAGTESGGRPDARRILGTIDTLVETSARRAELVREDAALARTESSLQELAFEAARARDRVDEIEQRLRALLVGIDALDLDGAVNRFARHCEERRRHDTAVAQLAALAPRLQAAGPDGAAALGDLAALLTHELLEREGDPAGAATAEPLDPAALSRLEQEATAARSRANAAALQAAQVASALAAALDNLPDVAALEDDLRACTAARERALHQRAAITKAIELLETSTRGVHRELAPQLATSIGRRLASLTDSRYTGVNVDTEHFAITLEGRERPDLVPLDQVSHGTRDQVSLLLRLALAEILSDGGESFPLFLDEPLLSSDPQRRDTILETICRLSEHHQVLLTTADPAIADAIVATLGDDAAVTVMDNVTPALRVDGVSIAKLRATS